MQAVPPNQIEPMGTDLTSNAAFIRRVLESSADCIKVLDLDARLQFMSAGGMCVMEIDDFTPFVGCAWLDFWEGPHSPDAREAVTAARAGGTGRFQGFCNTAKGTRKYWDVQITPINGADGKPEMLLSISRDISQWKQAEEHRQLLMEELQHRANNTLALVQAIAAQTLRGASSVEDAGETFSARLKALSKANEILTRRNWSGADIGSVVTAAIAPHDEPGRPRFRLAGPPVHVGSKEAVALGLALHELATNAAKYGALSTAAGRVDVTWDVGEEPPRLRLEWAEHGGPPVAVPSRRGFGSFLVERALAAQLNGEVELRFEPGGLVCRMNAPYGG